MNLIISAKKSKHTNKTYYYFEWGKEKGQRVASGIFTYSKPGNQIEKNHNKEALAILQTKKSQMILDGQSIGTGHMPQHKLKSNFLDYYSDFVRNNRKRGNRHLFYSLRAFKKFIGKDFISPTEINENLCERFRAYLLENLNGETPSGYFMRFKRVLKAAAKDGYFKRSPAEALSAKSGAKKIVKEILDEQEYTQLMNTPCLNYEVKKAFVTSLYTGLRWVDVKNLCWENIIGDVLRMDQTKTGRSLELPLHPMVLQILGIRKSGRIFQLPCNKGANNILAKWCEDAKIKKHITWHCARHSMSVLLQNKGTDLATVAGMLGHTTTKYVQQTYKRYQLSNAKNAISHLPMPGD
jgi:integrase/recombinase XerD